MFHLFSPPGETFLWFWSSNLEIFLIKSHKNLRHACFQSIRIFKVVGLYIWWLEHSLWYTDVCKKLKDLRPTAYLLCCRIEIIEAWHDGSKHRETLGRHLQKRWANSCSKDLVLVHKFLFRGFRKYFAFYWNILLCSLNFHLVS